MPTGYTGEVLKGETFQQFAEHTTSALSYVARSMQENGTDELPDPKKAGRYHKRELKKAEKRLTSVIKMSFNRAAKKAKKECQDRKDSLTRALAEVAINGHKLSEMQKQVEAYEPPATDRHKAHKAYMLDQLKITREHDANPAYYVEELAGLKPLTARAWKKQAVQEAREEVARHREELAKEKERVAEDVEFISQVRAAAKKVSAPKSSY